MDYYNYNNNNSNEIAASYSTESARKFMIRVYNWMTIGLAITGVISFLFAYTPQTRNLIMTSPGLLWIAIILQLVVVIAMSAAVNKISASTATIGFIIYSLLTGITLSTIFFVFKIETIASAFFVCAGMYLAMSIFGYLTKRSLSGLGSFMMMGLFGLIIASIVNLFVASSTLYWMINYVGVLVFAGLTAFDTQKIKEMSYQVEGDEMSKKAAIFGSLTLYLDFINLFLFLLRIFGGSRD